MEDNDRIWHVVHPGFVKCFGSFNYVTPEDNLCHECQVITEAEYVAGILNRYRREVEESLHCLIRDLTH